MKFKTTRLLTRPTISMKKQGAECFIEVSSAMYTGRTMKEDKGNDGKVKEPATIIDVINLETGEEAQLVVSSMIKSTFIEEYPDDSYVGKKFHICNLGKQEVKAGGGQQYNKLLIEEIDFDDETEVSPSDQEAPTGKRKSK